MSEDAVGDGGHGVFSDSKANVSSAVSVMLEVARAL